MNNLIRWYPFADILATNRAMDRFIDQWWQTSGGLNPGSMMAMPAIDLSETGKVLIVHAEVPGFKPEQINVWIEGNTLTLKGEYSTDEKREEGKYHVRERSTRSFQRSMTLPRGVDSNNTTAEFENGVLTTTLPKQPDNKAKKIMITAKPELVAEAHNGHKK